MNPFDALQDNSFDIITQTMGYDATWTPYGGAEQQSARVLFKDPNGDGMLAGADYSPINYVMEYRRGFFDGLYESARSGVVETVTVNGIAYYVRSVMANYDGKTLRAHLELKP